MRFKILPLFLIILLLEAVAGEGTWTSNDDLTGISSINGTGGAIWNLSLAFSQTTGHPTQLAGNNVCIGFNATAILFKDLFASGGLGAINEANTPGFYIYGGDTEGVVNLYINETYLNSSIDNRETHADVVCPVGEFVTNITGSVALCGIPPVNGDITAVNTNGDYLTGGCTTGACSLLVNETVLNNSVDARENDTTYTNGSCLYLAGTEFSFNAACDTDTTYSIIAGMGINQSGTALGLITCANNEILKLNSSGGWECSSDTDTTSDADACFHVVGNSILANLSCGSGTVNVTKLYVGSGSISLNATHFVAPAAYIFNTVNSGEYTFSTDVVANYFNGSIHCSDIQGGAADACLLTTDTNAGTECSGASTYLSGESTCNTLDGVEDFETPTNSTILIADGVVYDSVPIYNCPDSSGQHLNYNNNTRTFGCGTSSSVVDTDTNAKTQCADGEFLAGDAVDNCDTPSTIVTDGNGTKTTGGSIMAGNLTFNDNVPEYYGTGQDACIYYNGTELLIEEPCSI